MLAQTNVVGRHFDQLIGSDVFKRLFATLFLGRGNFHGAVGAGGADVGQLLRFLHVNGQIFVKTVLGDDHALIALFARIDEKDASLVATLCDSFGDRPEGFITEQTAYGAGGWDLDIPNVLRAETGIIPTQRHEVHQAEALGDLSDLEQSGCLVVLETNIDDCSPQVISYACERLQTTNFPVFGSV